MLLLCILNKKPGSKFYNQPTMFETNDFVSAGMKLSADETKKMLRAFKLKEHLKR